MARFAEYFKLFRPESAAAWSISIYQGDTPFSLRPHSGFSTGAVLSPEFLDGLPADGVADPFMIRFSGSWWMFFEIESRLSGRGEIGLAHSDDALSWHFDGIVLAESFHLSYPHVFEHQGDFYMVPESGAAGSVRLYRASRFPYQWTLCGVLIGEALVDPTIFHHQGRWWLIAQRGPHDFPEMVVYSAEELVGPWLAHPANPVYSGNRRISRPAGRVIVCRGRLIRFAQEWRINYGRSVRALEIIELTPSSFVEREIPGDPLLDASGHGWNATGMHHIDAHQLESGRWIACVDGRRTRWRLPAYTLCRKRLVSWWCSS